MIAFLSGKILAVRARSLVILAGSVGYEVFVNSSLLVDSRVDDEIKIWIHTHSTSDATTLFGFRDEKVLRFFELLTSVNGVGPRTALDILESPVEVVENTIASGDTAALGRTKGVGKKTAARIVLELKTKVAGGEVEVPSMGEVDSEAIDALVTLGYKKSDVEKILAKKPKEIEDGQASVRWFLSQN